MQWTAFELFWIGLTEDIEATMEAWRDAAVTDAPCRVKGQHGHVESSGNTDHAESRGGSNHEDLNHEVGNTSLRVRSDERTTIAGVKKGEEEEGIQGEQEAKPSPLPEGPTEGQVQEIVSGYCTALHWQYLTQEDFDAAVAAEFQKPGSGRQVVDVAAAQNTKEAASNG